MSHYITCSYFMRLFPQKIPHHRKGYIPSTKKICLPQFLPCLWGKQSQDILSLFYQTCYRIVRLDSINIYQFIIFIKTHCGIVNVHSTNIVSFRLLHNFFVYHIMFDKIFDSLVKLLNLFLELYFYHFEVFEVVLFVFFAWFLYFFIYGYCFFTSDNNSVSFVIFYIVI